MGMSNIDTEAILSQMQQSQMFDQVQMPQIFPAQKRKNYNSNCPHKDIKHYAKVRGFCLISEYV